MQVKRIFTLVIVLSLSLMLAACGGTNDSSNNGDNGNNAEAEATVEVPESATVTVATGGTVSVNYPSGWTATATDGTGTIMLAGERAKAEKVSVSFVGKDAAQALVGTGDLSSSSLLDNISQAILAAKVGVNAGAVSNVTLNDHSGTTMSASGNGFLAVFYVLEIDDGYALISGTTIAEQGDFRAAVKAIAGSISFAS